MIQFIFILSCSSFGNEVQEMNFIVSFPFERSPDGITDSGNGIINNTPPTAPEVHITPEDPSPGFGLSCAVRIPSEDPDADLLSYAFSWERNDLSYPLEAGELESNITEAGDYWTCLVTPFDGKDWGDIGSFTVFIQGCQLGSLAFTGEDYVEVSLGSSDSPLALGNEFTIESFTKLDDEAIDDKVVIVSQMDETNGWWFGGERTTNGDFELYFVTISNGVETKYQGDTLSPSSWRHTSVSVQNNILRLFDNGVIVGEYTWEGVDEINGTVLVGTLFRPGINGLPPSDDGGWQGLLDQVHISSEGLYNDSFSSQLQTQYSERSLLYYEFNEGSGTFAEDKSQHEREGTLYGPTWTNDSPCNAPD